MFAITKKKIFLTVSLLLFLADAILVTYNYRVSFESLNNHFEEDCRRFETSYNLLEHQICSQMLQLAHYIANNESIQKLFYEGKTAFEAEGGNGTGEQTSSARDALYQEVNKSWRKLQEVSDYRQLHFHLGPGSTSFLRVHAPNKFGDNMDNVRHTVVVANQEHRETSGFETGRVVSGIRGVVPVFYTPPGAQAPEHIGAIETGSSFKLLTDILLKNYDCHTAVFLTIDHVSACIWPEFLKQRMSETYSNGDFILEQGELDAVTSVITSDELKALYQGGPMILKKVKHQWFKVAGIELRDFKGKQDPDLANVGVILSWENVTEAIETFRQTQIRIVLIALISYAFIEILLYFSIRFVTDGLEKMIEHHRKDLIDKNANLKEANQRIRNQNKQLRFINQQKDEFIGIVSHDLKNPLASVIGTIDIFTDPNFQLSKTETSTLHLAMQRSCNHMYSIINNLLHIAKMDQGRYTPQKQSMILSEFLREALVLLEKQASEKDISIETELNGKSTIQMDPTALGQVFENLVSNAIKFSPPGKTIHISCGCEEKTDWFKVQDEGPGFTPEDKKKAFKPFTKLSARPTGDESSSGLGLSIVRRFIDIMDATVQLDSEPGKGTTFTVMIPKEG